MMLKHFLLLCMLAGLLSVCYSCGRGNGGNGGRGGNSGGNGNGGNGGNGGNAGKRSVEDQPAFSLDFQTFDVNRDGVITLAEFLSLQPGHEQLFDLADTDGNDKLTCEEFASEVATFGGEANC